MIDKHISWNPGNQRWKICERNKVINSNTKQKVIQSCVAMWPLLTYGCESWKVTKHF